MSRKITKLAVEAFFRKEPFSLDNTRVEIDENGMSWMLLHGSRIARLRGTRVDVNPCGFLTRTTKDRLNAIAKEVNCNIYQDRRTWYISRPDESARVMEANEWTVLYAGTTAEQIVYGLEQED